MSDLPLFLGFLCSAGEHGHMVCDLGPSRGLEFKAAVSPKEIKTPTSRIIRMFSASVLLWLSCWFQVTGTLGTVLFTVLVFVVGKVTEISAVFIIFSAAFLCL